MNIPYVKKFDENGKLLNPITKDNPYKSASPNRRHRQMKSPRIKHGRTIYGSVLKFGINGKRKYVPFRTIDLVQQVGGKKIYHHVTT